MISRYRPVLEVVEQRDRASGAERGDRRMWCPTIKHFLMPISKNFFVGFISGVYSLLKTFKNTTMTLFVIGLSGLKHSGKDTAAGHLIQRHGFIRVAFADKLKELAMGGVEAILDFMPWIDEDQLLEFESVLPWDGVNKEGLVRKLLQKLGTEFGRAHKETIWIDAVKEKIDKLYNEPRIDPELRIVITDVRFQNEMVFIENLAGNENSSYRGHSALWRIKRPSMEEEMLKDAHASEQEQLQVKDLAFSNVVINNRDILDLNLEVACGMSDFLYEYIHRKLWLT